MLFRKSKNDLILPVYRKNMRLSFFFVCDFRNVDLRELLPEYRIEPSALVESPSTTYDLISNVVHDGEPGIIKSSFFFCLEFFIFLGKGTYRVHVLHKVC
jgi:hypothetical protein